MRALAISELLRVRNGNASLCSSSLPFSNAHLPGACVNHKVGLMVQTWSLFGKWYNGRCTRCVLYCFMTCAPRKSTSFVRFGHLLARPGRQYYHSFLLAESGRNGRFYGFLGFLGQERVKTLPHHEEQDVLQTPSDEHSARGNKQATTHTHTLTHMKKSLGDR